MCWGHAINPDLNTRLYTLLFFPFLFWYDYFQETRPSQRTGPVIFKAKEKLILSFNCIKSTVIEILPHCWVRHGSSRRLWPDYKLTTLICQHLFKFLLLDTLPDKNSWDTSTERYFFPFRAPLLPLNVVNRSLVTISCTPTLRGQADRKVSQQFRLVVSLKRNLWYMLHVSLYWRENFCEAWQCFRVGFCTPTWDIIITTKTTR